MISTVSKYISTVTISGMVNYSLDVYNSIATKIDDILISTNTQNNQTVIQVHCLVESWTEPFELIHANNNKTETIKSITDQSFIHSPLETFEVNTLFIRLIDFFFSDNFIIQIYVLMTIVLFLSILFFIIKYLIYNFIMLKKSK